MMRSRSYGRYFALYIFLNFVLDFSHAGSPTFSGLPTSVSVGESETANRIIYTITVSDPDGDSLLCDVKSTSPSGAPFRVLKDTDTTKYGVYTNSPAFNFTATPLYSVTLECDDGTGISPATDTLSVDVIDGDLLSITSLPATVTKDASTVKDTDVIQALTATDALSHTPLFWSMTSLPSSSSFKIDSGTGTVSAARDLKFEINTPINLYVTVSDGNIEVTDILTVKLTNINNVPKFTNLPSTLNILESTASGTLLYTLTPYDADTGATLSYSMNVDPSSGADFFTYDTNTQKLSISNGKTFDYETVKYYNVTFTISDTLATGGPFVLDVNIQNVDEACYFDKSLYLLSTTEGSAGSISLNPGYKVLDYDGVSTYTLSFQTGNNSDRFTIDPSTGVVNFAVDYDVDNNAMPTTVLLTVQCKDSTAVTGTTQIQISISDENDNAPTFAQTSYVLSIDQFTTAGSLIGSVSPTDADSGTNAQFSCGGSSTSSIANTYYNIGSDCGVYLTASPSGKIDYGTMVRFTVTATDKGSTPKSGSTFVDIIFKETTTTSTTTTAATTTAPSFWDEPANVATFCLALIFGLLLLAALLYLLSRYCYTGFCCGNDPFDFCNCRDGCRQKPRPRANKREVVPRTPENPKRKNEDFEYWREDSDYGSMTKEDSKPRPQRGNFSRRNHFVRDYPDFPRSQRIITPTDVRPTTRVLPISYY